MTDGQSQNNRNSTKPAVKIQIAFPCDFDAMDYSDADVLLDLAATTEVRFFGGQSSVLSKIVTLLRVGSWFLGCLRGAHTCDPTRFSFSQEPHDWTSTHDYFARRQSTEILRRCFSSFIGTHTSHKLHIIEIHETQQSKPPCVLQMFDLSHLDFPRSMAPELPNANLSKGQNDCTVLKSHFIEIFDFYS